MPITDDEGLDRLLDADTVAVIGCSTTTPGRPPTTCRRTSSDTGTA